MSRPVSFGDRMKRFFLRFVIIGMVGYVVEVYFTGLGNLIHTIITEKTLFFDWSAATQAKTGILAFFVYCWAAIPYTLWCHELLKMIPNQFLGIRVLGVFIRGLIWGLTFMAIEFICGLVMKYGFHSTGWDYSSLPLNILGIITLVYYPAWVIAGMIGEWFHLTLSKIEADLKV